MPSDNLEENPDFIEARYVAGEAANTYDIELLAAAPELVDFGSGSDGSSNLAANTALISIGSGTIGSTGCPGLDQYVLALGETGIVTPKLAGLLVAGRDYLYNPLTGNFNKVIYTEIVLQETVRIKSDPVSYFAGETVVSLTHPFIVNKSGRKKPADECEQNELVMCCNEIGTYVHRQPLTGILPAGERWTIKISLEAEFLYATSKAAGDLFGGVFFICSNQKPPAGAEV